MSIFSGLLLDYMVLHAREQYHCTAMLTGNYSDAEDENTGIVPEKLNKLRILV
jgi:hypothetical protein